jgi:hypothetical protein
VVTLSLSYWSTAVETELTQDTEPREIVHVKLELLQAHPEPLADGLGLDPEMGLDFKRYDHDLLIDGTQNLRGDGV